MKVSQFRQLIREEVRKMIAEDNGVKELTYIINTPTASYQKFKKQIDALVSQGKLPKYTEDIYKYKYPKPGTRFTMTFKKAADVKLIDTIFKSSGVKKNEYETYNDFAPSSSTASKSIGNITALSDLDKKSLKKDVTYIFNMASKGEDMTDEIIDELGDYFELIQDTNDQKLIDAYEELRSFADSGDVMSQAKSAKKLMAILK